MFKSRVWIFILLALAALVVQLLVGQGRLDGQRCCSGGGHDLLIGYPSKNDPGSKR
jgi:hypothetical protein